VKSCLFIFICNYIFPWDDIPLNRIGNGKYFAIPSHTISVTVMSFFEAELLLRAYA